MLQQLHIKNYALIDELSVNFGKDLNIITGETGAGKSIILGALSLILGQRADTGVLKDDSRKCIIEGTYQIKQYDLKAHFTELELDYDEETIIRREILPSGKSRAFVNDSPVNLTSLKTLSNRLTDLNTQHQKFSIAEFGYQLYMLDVLSGHLTKVQEYQQLFGKYKQHKKKLAELKATLAKQQSESDYVNFQLSELNDAAFADEHEQDRIEKELKRLENSKEIEATVAQIDSNLKSGEHNIVDVLNMLISQLNKLAGVNPDFVATTKRLESIVIELEDIVQQSKQANLTTLSEPGRESEIQERLNVIYKLQTKHNVKTVAELITLTEQLNKSVGNTVDLEVEINLLEQSLLKEAAALFKLAKVLSKKRATTAKTFEKQLQTDLKQVGLSNAQVIYENTLTETELNDSGIDTYTLLFSANPGSAAKGIKQVASGGELSRLMLCIKNLLAGKVALPTIIFDEIDAGISGDAASMVAQKIETLSNNHQVICITHLPQMASKGKHHFQVYKETKNSETFTRIKQIEKDERIQVIAKLLGGSTTGNKAIENARELLQETAG